MFIFATGHQRLQADSDCKRSSFGRFNHSLYLADPRSTLQSNHGLSFYSKNLLLFIIEIT